MPVESSCSRFGKRDIVRISALCTRIPRSGTICGWLPHAFQVAIVAVMIRRKLYREFPVFLRLYRVGGNLGTCTLFVLDHSPAVSASQYWQANWLGSIGSIILRFGLIWEIFSHVFQPYPALWEVGKIVFRWAAIVLLLVGVAVAVYSPSPEGLWMLSGVFVIDRTISIIQCGLLLFLFSFSSYFGLSWRSYIFGIAAGLGIFATVQLVASSIWIQSGPVQSERRLHLCHHGNLPLLCPDLVLLPGQQGTGTAVGGRNPQQRSGSLGPRISTHAAWLSLTSLRGDGLHVVGAA